MTKILLLGGHGAVSLLLTPKLLRLGHNVTSVIRTKAQEAEILALGKDIGSGRGKVEVYVTSLSEVKSDATAKGILEETEAEWVVWSAGKFFVYLSVSSISIE
jgi:putative NADH-flavin reductase